LSDTIEPMPRNGANQARGERQDLQVLAAELVQRAKNEGVELVGPGVLLTGLAGVRGTPATAHAPSGC
jgi:putative transposase